MRKILIIRLGAMGDVILASPVIRALKNRFPDSSLDFAVKDRFASLLEGNPYLNTIIRMKTFGRGEFSALLSKIRAEHYDAVIDLQTNGRSLALWIASGARRVACFRHYRFRRFLLVRLGIDFYREVPPVPLRFLAAVRRWGVEDDGLGLEVHLSKRTQQKGEALLAQHGIGGKRRIVALAPGAGRATKRWPAEGYIKVAEHFGKNGYTIILLGGKEDKELSGRIVKTATVAVEDFTGTTGWQESAALLSRSQLLVTNDTGVMHLACGLDIPVVALFGPTTVHLGFHPFRARSRVAEISLPCRPCSYHGTAHCPKGHFRCLRDISPDRVIQLAEELLAQDRP